MTDNLPFIQPILNSQNEQIDTKFQNRHELLFEKENFSQIKEDSINKELSLGKSIREKYFVQKRLKQKLNKEFEISNSEKIIDKLTIPNEFYEKCKNMSVNINQLKETIISFNSNDINQKYLGIVGLRKLLCLKDPPIQILLDMDILPGLTQLLRYSPVEFQYEALWCLINISTGNQAQVAKIKNVGGIDLIIESLDHNMNEIKELAIWNLENISLDSSKMRNYLIHKKVLNKLITILSITNSEIIGIRCIFAIRNLIKNYKKNNEYNIDFNRLINLVSRYLMSIKYDPENKDIKQLYYDSLCILSYLSENIIECKGILLESGVIPFIIELLRNKHYENEKYFILGGLKVLGNIISGNANHTQKVLDLNIYDILKKYMFHENKRIKKEANWIISNIAAGTERNIIDLVYNGFFPLIIQIFQKEPKDIKIEATWALCNFSQIKDTKYIKSLLNQGLLRIVCECLKSDEIKEVAISLEALFNLLAFGKKYSCDGNNSVAYEMEKMGMLSVLENLQYHRNEVIYEKSLKLIETFFSVE